MKNRVLGFSGLRSSFPVVLIHGNAENDSLVNGCPLQIHLGVPGCNADEGTLLIRLSNQAEMSPGDFISFAEGVLLKRKEDDSVSGQMRVVNRGFLSVSSNYEIWPQIRT